MQRGCSCHLGVGFPSTRHFYNPFYVRLSHGRKNFHRFAFCEKIKVYNFLSRMGVKRWKDRFWAWDRSLFVLQKLDNERMAVVLQNNISAELTHWVCAFVGLLAIPFGLLLSMEEWAIYVITSVLTSLFADFPPICIQRFNRYRLQQILKSQSKLNAK